MFSLKTKKPILNSRVCNAKPMFDPLKAELLYYFKIVKITYSLNTMQVLCKMIFLFKLSSP